MGALPPVPAWGQASGGPRAHQARAYPLLPFRRFRFFLQRFPLFPFLLPAEAAFLPHFLREERPRGGTEPLGGDAPSRGGPPARGVGEQGELFAVLCVTPSA